MATRTRTQASKDANKQAREEGSKSGQNGAQRGQGARSTQYLDSGEHGAHLRIVPAALVHRDLGQLSERRRQDGLGHRQVAVLRLPAKFA